MYSTCLFCNESLGSNQTIESFPVGSRLAFDPAHGRLWVVCRHCERWNLTPIEERWEAVEDCERRFTDARKRFCTDNIGLARVADDVELVRIGDALRTEFAAWRYGDQFGRRRRRTIIAGSALAAAVGALAAGTMGLGVATAGGYWVYRAGDEVLTSRRNRRLIARIPTDDGETVTVLGSHLSGARLSRVIGDTTGVALTLPHLHGSSTLRDHHALHAAALIMPAVNGTGGTRDMVSRAMKRLENFDHPSRYLLSAAAVSVHPSRPGGLLARLPVDMRLAIEMAANEENERFALEGEMWLLEMAWREAEEIAAIADGLTIPAEIERRLEELRRTTE